MNNNDLNNLISNFVNLSTEEKANEIIVTLKENIAMVNNLCNKLGVQTEIILNREMSDVQKENATIDDYFEAIFAYIKSLQDANGKLLLILSSIIDNANNG